MRKFFNDLYQLRIEVAFWLTLLAFAPLGEKSSLFRGILALESRKHVAWMCFVAYLSAAMLMVFTNLVLFYGDIRLNSKKEPLEPKPQPDNGRTVAVFFVCLVPASVLVACCDSYTLQQQPSLGIGSVLFATAVGLAGAAAAVLLAKALQVTFATPLPGQQGEPHFILPLGWVPLLGPWFERQYCEKSVVSRVPGLRNWLHPFKRIFGRVGEGYFSYDANGQPGLALPGQGFAASLAVVVFLFYELSGLDHLRDLGRSSLASAPLGTPTILHVLLALLLLATLLSGAAFFLDRYRIPLSLAIATLLAFTFFVTPDQKSDHEFQLLTHPGVSVFSPRDTVVSKQRKRLVAVAAAGGGIQAAAWTAKVLAELQSSRSFGANFSSSVAVMSGVSGGSVGILNYLTTYPDVSDLHIDASNAVANAEHDSLEGIAWGLVHPDFWRAVFPMFARATVDRGWALERFVGQASGTANIRLSDLTSRARELPVLLINSTETETGAPIVFPTSDFPRKSEAAGIDNFRTVYGRDADLRVATAVRLSATFPFVSPTARPSSGPAFHFVDAGYYDDYGMVSLLAWIRDAFLKSPDPAAESIVSADMTGKQLLILEINGFPAAGDPEACPEPWPFQLPAPILALYDVREHTQQARNAFELALQSKAQWFQQHVMAVEFRYNPQSKDCRGDPPLSWHLTERERGCIDEAWTESVSNLSSAQTCVAKFLSGSDDLSECKLPPPSPTKAAGCRK